MLGRLALVPDLSGALWLPDERTLVVADLHLEKGSAYAARGIFLPPYDSAATLAALAAAILRHAPARVIALGDSFHDIHAESRIAPGNLATLRQLQQGRDWLWITGNHDREIGPAMGARRPPASKSQASPCATNPRPARPVSRSPAISIRRRKSECAAAPCGGAASPCRRAAASCRLWAPMPAD